MRNDGRTDGHRQTDRHRDTYDMTNLIVTFGNFANASKNYCMLSEIFSRNTHVIWSIVVVHFTRILTTLTKTLSRCNAKSLLF